MTAVHDDDGLTFREWLCGFFIVESVLDGDPACQCRPWQHTMATVIGCRIGLWHYPYGDFLDGPMLPWSRRLAVWLSGGRHWAISTCPNRRTAAAQDRQYQLNQGDNMAEKVTTTTTTPGTQDTPATTTTTTTQQPPAQPAAPAQPGQPVQPQGATLGELLAAKPVKVVVPQ